MGKYILEFSLLSNSGFWSSHHLVHYTRSPGLVSLSSSPHLYFPIYIFDIQQHFVVVFLFDDYSCISFLTVYICRSLWILSFWMYHRAFANSHKILFWNFCIIFTLIFLVHPLSSKVALVLFYIIVICYLSSVQNVAS